ncbi:YfhO family protein [Paractinoplanes toevensis]|uniref:Membrane protein n=1 Tax=Paractinoplanes toevensis TaxID=571911 RepID=A0A919T8I4_9ACTN|nr:YfhO family protein [Actinoplanes toevensis]GIM90823.1 membrane protein [Actinoplanes toevensis]
MPSWTTREFPAAAAAALLSMGAYCLSLFANGIYPFGPTSRAVNDLGNQFIPFHAELWDLEHGKAAGDLFFSWSSGYGTAFLPDFFSFLTNPFSWLVGLFPRDLLDLPVFLVTLLSLGLAAALMTVFLGRLAPGSPWWRMLLGVGYGLCGWVINDAFADPMWLWGLAALPAICIAADWCLQERHWVPGTLIIAAAWLGNFYTAAMVTIAAALIFLVRLLLTKFSWAVLLRAGSMTLVGVLLAAPVIIVCGLASNGAQPPPAIDFRGAPPLLDILAQFLPGGKSLVSSPNILIGMFGLLLVAAFPFHRGVPAKERLAWIGLLVLVLLSFFWRPTILLWHGLAIPNGSPYRAAFVFSGMLTMVAWLSLARRPRVTALLGGAALILAILVFARNTTAVRPSTWRSVLIGGPLMLGALVLLLRVRTSRWLRTGSAAVLVAGVFFGAAYSTYVADAVRKDIPFFDPHPTLQQSDVRSTFDAIQAARTWPAARVESGPHRFANGDPALLRAEGSRYYDTYVMAETSQALQSLGISWTWRGRHIHSPTDPVTRALMAVNTYVDDSGAVVPAGPAAPMVTVHPAGSGNQPFTSVFARQEALLGATVYETPALTWTDGPAATPAGTGWQVPPTPKGSRWTTFTATCTPGREAYFYTPWFAGAVHSLQSEIPFVATEPMTSNPMRLLGTVPADGKVKLEVWASRPQVLPAPVLGCLDRAAFATAVERLRATGATKVEAGGHTLSATLPAGSTGTAMVAAPAVKGWSCGVDGGARHAPISYYGFIGVPLTDGATRVDCSFEPPGLRPGLAVAGVALIALLAVPVVATVRRRRR